MLVESHSESAGNITADNRRITSFLSDMILVVGTDMQSCSGLHSLRGLSVSSLGLQWEVNLRRGLDSGGPRAIPTDHFGLQSLPPR